MAAQEHRIIGINSTAEGGSLKPCTYEPPLDAHRCVALHNALVQKLSQPAGVEVGYAKAETWWERFGNKIDSPETKFHPAVTVFLQAAWYSWRNDSNTSTSDETSHLFWGIKGISSLERIFDNGVAERYAGMDTLDVSEADRCSESDDDTDDETPPPESPPTKALDQQKTEEPLDADRYRFITLYQSAARPVQGGEPLGVIFDQRQHKAIFVSTTSVVPDSLSVLRGWHPLEVILDLWHGMIDQGKVIAVDGQWLMQPVGTEDLSNTLRAWHELIDNIESRLLTSADAPRESVEYLLSQEIAQSLGLSGFRQRFLTAARRPRFRYIAPGLAIPTTSGLVECIKQSHGRSMDESAPTKPAEQPLLLFPVVDPPSSTISTTRHQRISQQTDPANTASERLFPHSGSIAPQASFEPGLYLSSTNSEQHPYADSFRLVLPYAIGANGCARTSSLDPIENCYAELYQLGYDDTGGGSGSHDAQLATLFDRWTGRLREAHSGPFTRGWGVVEDGVEGIEDDGEVKGIEIFRNADEGAISGTYQLPGPLVLNAQRCAAMSTH